MFKVCAYLDIHSFDENILKFFIQRTSEATQGTVEFPIVDTCRSKQLFWSTTFDAINLMSARKTMIVALPQLHTWKETCNPYRGDMNIFGCGKEPYHPLFNNQPTHSISPYPTNLPTLSWSKARYPISSNSVFLFGWLCFEAFSFVTSWL